MGGLIANICLSKNNPKCPLLWEWCQLHIRMPGPVPLAPRWLVCSRGRCWRGPKMPVRIRRFRCQQDAPEGVRLWAHLWVPIMAAASNRILWLNHNVFSHPSPPQPLSSEHSTGRPEHLKRRLNSHKLTLWLADSSSEAHWDLASDCCWAWASDGRNSKQCGVIIHYFAHRIWFTTCTVWKVWKKCW